MHSSGSFATAAPPPSPERKVAPYIFYGQTTSLCETCLVPIPAKVIIEGSDVFYLKRCRNHGVQKTLISDDLDYWQAQKLWLKPGDRPLATQTRTEAGCTIPLLLSRATQDKNGWPSAHNRHAVMVESVT